MKKKLVKWILVCNFINLVCPLFEREDLTLAIFILLAKIPKLKEALELWTNGFLMYFIHCLIRSSGISSKPAEELPFKLFVKLYISFPVTEYTNMFFWTVL